MANVISSFLVGIGFDFDQKGAKQIDSSINHIKSTALQAGAAIAGAFGVKKLTSDFANANKSLLDFAQANGVAAESVSFLGRVHQRAGGGIAELSSELENLDNLRARMLTGDFSFIPEGMKTGLNMDAVIEAENAFDAYRDIIRQSEGLTREQRKNVSNVFGMGQASTLLMDAGLQSLDLAMVVEESMRPWNQAAARESKIFVNNWQSMWTRIGGITDRASAQMLPAVNDLIAGMNGFIDSNKVIINQGVDKTFGFIADNLVAVSVAGAALGTGGVLGTLSKIAAIVPTITGRLPALAAGMGKLAGSAGLATIAWMAGQKIGESISESLPDEANMNIGRTIAQALAFVGHEDSMKALAAESGTIITPSAASVPIQQQQRTVMDYAIEASKSSSYRYGEQKQNINVNVDLNGKPFNDMIIKVLSDQSEQVLEEMKSPYKG